MCLEILDESFGSSAAVDVRGAQVGTQLSSLLLLSGGIHC